MGSQEGKREESAGGGVKGEVSKKDKNQKEKKKSRVETTGCFMRQKARNTKREEISASIWGKFSSSREGKERLGGGEESTQTVSKG